MSITIHSAITLGLQVIPISVEAALGNGFSGLQFIGLPNDYARDAKERIRASLEGLGIALPARRLLVSVRPSETLKLFKTGLEHLDLPCALAVLSALAQQQNAPRLTLGSLRLLASQLSIHDQFFAGQLTLSGEILPLENTLPFEILALQRKEKPPDFWCCITSNKPTSEAAAQFKRVHSLQECVKQVMFPNPTPTQGCSGSERITPSGSLIAPSASASHNKNIPEPDSTRLERIEKTLSKFEQCPSVGFALCIAAAGRHHILLAGSPGCGKTFSLRSLKNLLPALTPQERIEVALIQNRETICIRERPFRTPHHSASSAALLGGSLLQPGEVSLAHHGVLFLDEFAEFPRPSLEALREPLDERKISLSRARGRVELPANFMLLAATNPCACGYVFSRSIQCRCQVGAPIKYQQKLSGPLLERFSILLLMDTLQHQHTTHAGSEEESSYVLKSLSEEWFKAIQENPTTWSKHFLEVQAELWERRTSEVLSSETQALIAARSKQNNWSTRKRLRIVELLLTCQRLLSKQFTFNLNSHQLLQLTEELRTLEQTLQKGVYLLTPIPPLPILKKN